MCQKWEISVRAAEETLRILKLRKGTRTESKAFAERERELLLLILSTQERRDCWHRRRHSERASERAGGAECATELRSVLKQTCLLYIKYIYTIHMYCIQLLRGEDKPEVI